MTPKTGVSGVPALNKARADIEQIAAEMGYAPFVLHAPDSANGSVWLGIQVGAKTLGDWVRAFYRMRQGDLLLVQYPYFPVKGYGVARLALHLLRWKGVKTAALVHDLDSLRRIGGSARARERPAAAAGVRGAHRAQSADGKLPAHGGRDVPDDSDGSV